LHDESGVVMDGIDSIRYGMVTLALTLLTGVGGAFWWISDQTHRIGVNETDIRGIKADLAGKQDVAPVAARLTQLEARWHDTGPMLQRLTVLETQQTHLTTTVARMDEAQGRMFERLTVIDRRLTETSINVTANQETARKILEQQNAIMETIKRALPDQRGDRGGFRLQSEESKPWRPELKPEKGAAEIPGRAGSQSGPNPDRPTGTK
jgi:hypothetical protein